MAVEYPTALTVALNRAGARVQDIQEVHDMETCVRIAELAHEYALSGGVFTAAERFFIAMLAFFAGC